MNRKKHIDVLKGIAILLVVIGHMPFITGDYIHRIIYWFHVPIFFIVAGYVANYDDHLGLYVFKRFLRLIVPFVGFCVGLLFIDILVYGFSASHTIRVAKGILIGGSYLITDNRFYIAMWFLPCLFIAQCIYYPLSRMTLWMRIAAVASAVIASSHMFGRIASIHHLDIALFSIVYLLIGDVYRRFETVNIPFRDRKLPIIVWLILASIPMFIQFPIINLNIRRMDPLFTTLIFQSAVFFSLVLLSRRIVHNEKLERLENMLTITGRYSLQILCLHFAIITLVRMVIL